MTSYEVRISVWSSDVCSSDLYQSDLWGFLEVEEFVFGERTQVVVDPSEEKLKAQFEGVVRSCVPMHSIVRIDEVERLGTPKISEARGAVGKDRKSTRLNSSH